RRIAPDTGRQAPRSAPSARLTPSAPASAAPEGALRLLCAFAASLALPGRLLRCFLLCHRESPSRTWVRVSKKRRSVGAPLTTSRSSIGDGDTDLARDPRNFSGKQVQRSFAGARNECEIYKRKQRRAGAVGIVRTRVACSTSAPIGARRNQHLESSRG